MRYLPRQFTLNQLIGATVLAGTFLGLVVSLTEAFQGRPAWGRIIVLAAVTSVALWLLVRGARAVVATYALGWHLLAIVLFGAWFAKTDWMFGHVQGPPTWLILAMLCAAMGIGCTVLRIVLWLCDRIQLPKPGPRGWLAVFRLVLLVPACLLSCLILCVGLEEWPRAVQRLEIEQIQRIVRGEVGREDVAQLIEALAHRDGYVRWRAAEALAKIGPQASPAVPALIRAMGDTDPGSNGLLLRVNAMVALGEIGPAASAAIPALVEVVRQGSGSPETDNEPDVMRGNASQALAKIGPASVPALIKLLEDENPYVRCSAAGALGTMGSQATSAVPILVRAAEADPDDRVRPVARVAVERVKSDHPQ